MKRLLSAVAAVVLALLALPAGGAWAATSPARAAGGSTARDRPPQGVQIGSNRLDLLGQSTFVQRAGSFDLRLGISTPDPSADRLQVLAYPRLTTRTAFLAAQSGHLPAYSIWGSAPLPLTTLARSTAGGVELEIPVDRVSSNRQIPTFTTSSGAPEGVYPLQVALYNANGVPLGPRLTTFLVYVGARADFARLSVALILPFSATPPIGPNGAVGAVSATASKRLADIAGALGASAVPVTLAVSPYALDALSGGPPIDQATLHTLSRAISSAHDELLPASYVPLDIPGMLGAGMGGEVARQYAQGSATIASKLGARPSSGTWAVPGRLDARSLAFLARLGLARLVVPNRDLTKVPRSYRRTTFAEPTRLSGSSMRVVGADDTLAKHFVSAGNQVMAAQDLLAELSMIQMETPSVRRGVAVIPPRSWAPNAAFLATVLEGLAANPILSPVRERTLFATVPDALSYSGRPLVRNVAARSSSSTVSGASAVRSSRRDLEAIAAIVPQQTRVAASLRRRILLAEAYGVSRGVASGLLSSVASTLKKVEAGIELAPPGSITLTARDGQLPLTLLARASLGAHVELRLHSAKLTFRAFTPPGGTCSRPGPATEVCQLRLVSAQTTLQVPVEARTSGVFGLQEELLSPNGTVTIAANRDVIRSTAVSDVGIALIVVAAIFLAVWWVRDLRHGRRASRLVDPGDVDLTGPPAETGPGQLSVNEGDGAGGPAGIGGVIPDARGVHDSPGVAGGGRSWAGDVTVGPASRSDLLARRGRRAHTAGSDQRGRLRPEGRQ